MFVKNKQIYPEKDAENKTNEILIEEILIEEVEEKKCRICLEINENYFNNKLIQSCECKGSLKYIHQKCLIKWIKNRYDNLINNVIEEDLNEYMIKLCKKKSIKCEICKHNYKPRYVQSNKIFNCFNCKIDKYWIILYSYIFISIVFTICMVLYAQSIDFILTDININNKYLTSGMCYSYDHEICTCTINYMDKINNENIKCTLNNIVGDYNIHNDTLKLVQQSDNCNGNEYYSTCSNNLEFNTLDLPNFKYINILDCLCNKNDYTSTYNNEITRINIFLYLVIFNALSYFIFKNVIIKIFKNPTYNVRTAIENNNNNNININRHMRNRLMI
jgi:hypothetical protein